MVLMRKTFGYQTLGPFYVISQMFGLLLVREVDNKVRCSEKGGGGVFSPDRRFLAYNALVTLWFYAALRRCVTLVAGWPCGGAVDCPSAVEWIVTAAGAAQAMACVALATAHRQSSTVDLLNSAHDVLTARGGGGGGGRRSHVNVAVAYAATVTAIASVRWAAVAAARPDRFAAVDVLLVCAPVAAVPVAVECAFVCVCSAAEDACRDVVDRLDRLAGQAAAAAAVAPSLNRRADVRRQLQTAWRDYRRCCRLVGRLSGCYGLDLAVDLTANMLFFVVYAYATMMSAYASFAAGTAAATFTWNLALACQLACVSFRTVFMSYRAEKIKQAGENLVLISLRNLLKNNNLDISTVMLINSFTYQIVNRELKVSACGFFSVNLSFFHALLRLATTYLIVIIQYNSKPSQAPSQAPSEPVPIVK